MLPLSLLPSVAGITGVYYFLGAVLMGLVFVWSSLQFSRSLSREAARRLLLVSVIYVPVVLTLMVADAHAVAGP